MSVIFCVSCGKPILAGWTVCKWCGAARPAPAVPANPSARRDLGPPAKRGWEGRAFAISALVAGIGWVGIALRAQNGVDLRRLVVFVAGPCVFGPVFALWGLTLLIRRKLAPGAAAIASTGMLVAVLAAAGAIALAVFIAYMILSGKWPLMP